MTIANPLGQPIDPTWFILIAAPTRDRHLEAWLRKIGLVDVWRPVETAWKPCKGQRRKVAYERSIAPGYLFCLFDREPIWHVLFEQAGRRARGVVGFHELPYAVPERVMAQMRMVPQRIEVMRKAEEERRRAERLARMPKPGDAARHVTGPLAGHLVDVSRVDAGIAYFMLGGIKGETPIDNLERVARAAE